MAGVELVFSVVLRHWQAGMHHWNIRGQGTKSCQFLGHGAVKVHQICTYVMKIVFCQSPKYTQTRSSNIIHISSNSQWFACCICLFFFSVRNGMPPGKASDRELSSRRLWVSRGTAWPHKSSGDLEQRRGLKLIRSQASGLKGIMDDLVFIFLVPFCFSFRGMFVGGSTQWVDDGWCLNQIKELWALAVPVTSCRVLRVAPWQKNNGVKGASAADCHYPFTTTGQLLAPGPEVPPSGSNLTLTAVAEVGFWDVALERLNRDAFKFHRWLTDSCPFFSFFAGTSHRFSSLPGRWLHQQCWDDDPNGPSLTHGFFMHCIYNCVHTHVVIRTVSTRAHLCIYIYIYLCVYVFVTVYVYVYVDVYMHTHTYTYTHAFVCMGWVAQTQTRLWMVGCIFSTCCIARNMKRPWTATSRWTTLTLSPWQVGFPGDASDHDNCFCFW